MTTIGTVSPIRILICSPVDGVLGGIPAAVGSLLQGLSASRRVAVTRMPYAVYGRYSSKLIAPVERARPGARVRLRRDPSGPARRPN